MFKNWKEKWRLYASIAILVLSAVISPGFVAYAVFYTHCDADGGRGGAIADGFALCLMFYSQSYASRLYKLRAKVQGRLESAATNPVSEAQALKLIRAEIVWLLDSLDDDAEIQRNQNIILAIATAIGIFFWGFGDLIAKKIMHHPC